MSYSKLANYKAMTSHMSSGRGGNKVIKIAIHHMAGNLSVEQCGKVFKNNQDYAHYGVNGKNIGVYVDETNTAWALGSFPWNQKSINIECANDGGASKNWHVSDTTIETTIDLVVDIAYRLGWTYIAYDGTLAGSDIIMHKWIASTACPGPYLASKMKYIATEADKRLKAKRKGGKTPAKKKKLTVDGVWGVSTTKALQKWLGRKQEGVIARQPKSYKKYLIACSTTSWKFVRSKGSGSGTIKALQKKLGVKANGYCGKSTIKALQKLLGVKADGYCGKATVTALQKYLNKRV